jgi:DNA polymerase-1
MIISPQTKEAYRLFHDGTLALARAEQQGIRVNMEYCEKKSDQLSHKIQRLEEQFYRTEFFKEWNKTTRSRINIHSNVQLGNFLYKVKKFTPANTTATGKGGTDEESLSQLGISELNLLLEIRKLKKSRDTYLGSFIREAVEGYLHPSFNLHLVKTFRSSSDRPNFQNIPKRDEDTMRLIRKALYPRPGHQLMEVDYSGLEVRIAAAYHKDPTMLKYILDPSTDMHRDMAEQIFLMDDFDKSDPTHKTLRSAAKNGFVFPQFYGDYFKNCAINLACRWGKLPEGRWKAGQGIDFNGGKLADHFIGKGIRSIDKFTDHLREIESDFWNNRFPVYQEWKEKWWKEYQKKGYVDMYTGFRCSGEMGRNDAINYPVQGAAFHCLLWSFIRLDAIMQRKGWKTRLIGQIHDAIVLDVHPDELHEVGLNIRLVTTGDLPRNWPWINVPLEIDADLGGVDESWADLKPYQLPYNVHN